MSHVKTLASYTRVTNTTT